MSSRFFKLSRFTNCQVVISQCAKYATIHLPGLSLDDFNRVGSVAIWRLLHWFSWSRISAYHTHETENGLAFLEYDKMTSQVFTFLASTRTTVNEAFYQLLNSSVKPQLAIKMHLGYIGTSSLNSVALLSDVNTGSILARNVNQVVSVDSETRKPKPLPDWWKQKYESSVVDNERLVLPTFEVPAQNTYKYSMKVSWNDIDAYRHVNYQSYVRFCFDAAMDAVDKKFLSGFEGDILNYDVKSIECAYKGECFACEEITVVTWQKPENPKLLQFSIENRGKVIFQSSVEFF